MNIKYGVVLLKRDVGLMGKLTSMNFMCLQELNQYLI